MLVDFEAPTSRKGREKWGTHNRGARINVGEAMPYRKALDLANAPELVHGPVAEDGLAVDKFLLDRPETSAVIRHGAVIPEHEIRTRRHHGFGIRTRIRVLRRHIFLVERLAIDVDQAAVDADAIASHTDH